jgi:two-component system, OmpR family, sensor histidine kinase CiaH
MNKLAVRNFFGSTTARLAASYLSIIMVMSLSFSIVSYNTSSRELGRQLPPDSLFQEDHPNDGFAHSPSSSPRVNAFISDRIDEGRHTLLVRFIIVNALVLAGGSALSYYLARRTLQPIEDSMEAQAQFISDASHELRTPLTSIQTANEVALRDKSLGIADARTILAQNVEEVEKLKTLTDGLVKLARKDNHDNTALTMEQVDVQDVTSEAMNRIMRLALEKDIAIDDHSRPGAIFGDQQTLVQALVVLLDNAIKYSSKGSTIHISSTKKAKQILLSVRDEGPGIRPYDQRKIFDRFYRADQSRSNQHVPGNGIGLALAQKIVEQHGGDITVASTIGKGSTFTIRIPAA